MSVYTELLPETKSEKHGAIQWEPATDNAMSPVAGTLTITGKRNHCRYLVEEFGCDRGRGFVLFKLDDGSDKTEERYGCFAGGNGSGHCECKGYHATGRCKHLQAVKALIENHWL